MEEWRNIEGYGERCQVSNKGNVRYQRSPRWGQYKDKKVTMYGANRVVYLHKHGKTIRTPVDYLVSQAFPATKADGKRAVTRGTGLRKIAIEIASMLSSFSECCTGAIKPSIGDCMAFADMTEGILETHLLKEYKGELI
jgi:hypothetical protein